MAKEPATPTTAAPAAKPLPIAIIPQDGFNLQIEEQIDPYNVIVKLTTPAHNWFAGTFTNLPTDKEVTIVLSMEGNDTNGNKVDVSKWVGLRPVMTYADPEKYETYEWFTKDAQKRWESGDPFKQGDAKFAGTGKVPEQKVIPVSVAEQFLSSDGKYWQPWREVDSAAAVPGLSLFRFSHKFKYPTATVAMRIPYTYTLQQAIIGRLRAVGCDRIHIDEIGETANHRQLQVFRVNPPKTEFSISLGQPVMSLDHYRYRPCKIDFVNGIERVKEQRVIVIIAREHGTESTGSWFVQSMMSNIINGNKYDLQNTILLFIPIFEVDASCTSFYKGNSNNFIYAKVPESRDLLRSPLDEYFMNRINTPPLSPETISYAIYLNSYNQAGYPIAIACSIHNPECNEFPNATSPYYIKGSDTLSVSVNVRILKTLSKACGLIVGNPETLLGAVQIDERVVGWCNNQFGTLGLTYEINDRYPSKRLTIRDVNDASDAFIGQILQWLNTQECVNYLLSLRVNSSYRRAKTEIPEDLSMRHVFIQR